MRHFDIEPPSVAAMAAAQKRWDSIAKPLHSLGVLEDDIVAIAGIAGSDRFSIKKRCLIAMCADNGVVAQGVTQTSSEITSVVTENFAKGCTSVCAMARRAGAEVIPVDIGVKRRPVAEGIVDRNLMRGTYDFTKGPAMAQATAEKAVETGIEMVRLAKEQGYELIATGEMGIGNTTTSSAVGAVLLSIPVEEATGVGAGLDKEGLMRKKDAIRRGIELNRPDKDDAIDVVSKVGGLDIAGMAGVFIGGALYRVPVLIDGVISAVAALVAVRLVPACRDFMIASHSSKEPLGRTLLESLGKKPLIDCGMCLGEGTGAVATMPLLDMAKAVYDDMCTFAETNLDQYEELDG